MSAGGEKGDEVEEVEEEVFKTSLSPLSSPLSLSAFFFFFSCSSYICLSSACERRDLAAVALARQYWYFGPSKASCLYQQYLSREHCCVARFLRRKWAAPSACVAAWVLLKQRVGREWLEAGRAPRLLRCTHAERPCQVCGIRGHDAAGWVFVAECMLPLGGCVCTASTSSRRCRRCCCCCCAVALLR